MNRTQINVLFFLSLIMITLMTFFVASAQAAQVRPTATSGGLFTGSFEGVLYGDDGSKAPVVLELVQNGRDVTGEISVGRGLIIDGGNCGAVEVPATSQTATGRTTAAAPRQLDAVAAFKVQGINVTINLDSELSRDGEDITAEARIDLPWLCGRDPVINGEFTRAD